MISGQSGIRCAQDGAVFGCKWLRINETTGENLEKRCSFGSQNCAWLNGVHNRLGFGLRKEIGLIWFDSARFLPLALGRLLRWRGLLGCFFSLQSKNLPHPPLLIFSPNVRHQRCCNATHSGAKSVLFMPRSLSENQSRTNLALAKERLENV